MQLLRPLQKETKRPLQARLKVVFCAGAVWWQSESRCQAFSSRSLQPQRFDAGLPPLKWSPEKPSLKQKEALLLGQQEEFRQQYFEDDNVLFLYVIQRNLLQPQVKERIDFHDGKFQVQIEWNLEGKQLRAFGVGSNKRLARRKAAGMFLKKLPVGAEVHDLMRKQMLNGLRMRLSATVVQDGPVTEPFGPISHKTVWRVPQPGGRAPVELSATGRGGTSAEAQAAAWESLYLQASKRLSLAEEAAAAAKEQRSLAGGDGGGPQVGTHPALSSEAASELAIRHNALVQKLRIMAKDEVVQHDSSYHATLSWQFVDSTGTPRHPRTTGVGSSKSVAKAQAIHTMLVQEGFAEDLPAEVLNQAARIRAMVKAEDPSAVPAACGFLDAWPASTWSLALPETWQLALSREDADGISNIGLAIRRRIEEGCRLTPQLWEQLLDACAYITCPKAARQGLLALEALALTPEAFPSEAHMTYFSHFRFLTAMERVGANQAAVEELKALGSHANGVLLRKQTCVLPYLTLVPGDEAVGAQLTLLDLRAGDVVLVHPLLPPTEGDGQQTKQHMATVTSYSQGDAGSKLTLRCSTISAAEVNAAGFEVYSLESEVTALRETTALRVLADPINEREAKIAVSPKTSTQRFSEPLRQILLESFSCNPHAAAEEVFAVPPGCSWSDPAGLDRCLGSVVALATAIGHPLSESQTAAIRSALQHRLTLIHGPPGTGKTTAAVCVVLAWRHLGEKILCAADSNVAADQLHSSLVKWGVKALRFSPAEAVAAGSDQGGWTPGAVKRGESLGANSDSRRGRRPASPRGPENNAYLQLQRMMKAVDDYQVVVTTCSSAAHELLSGVVFPRVLVDECTQSVEPSTLLPLSHGCEHLVLIGDHKQLPPTVMSEEAKRRGLARSLFTRLVADGSGEGLEPVLLDVQRRMHPSIAFFPNMHFYDSRVRDMVPFRPVIAGVPWPKGGDIRVLLVDVPTQAGEDRRGTSWQNEAEVDAVLELTTHVLHAGDGTAAPLPPEEVVVVTPYMKQKQLFQAKYASANRASPSMRSLAQVRISTVDGFQGAEADLVVFSAVRSNDLGRLGFLDDVRRTNVLLTRARRGLIVFADAGTIRKSRDTVWAKWLSWVEGNDAVLSLEKLRAHIREGGAARTTLQPRGG